MNEIMKFDGTDIGIQKIDGVWMFELYAVGMALGYARSNGKSAGEHGVHPENRTLFPYKSRIDKVVQNAEIKPCVHNGHKYITESQLYDLMLEARTEKCRAFRKWLTNEVLPALNHKGSYSVGEGTQLALSEKPYEYFDKTWKGEPVITSEDFYHLTGVRRSCVSYYFRTHREFVECIDFYLLGKNEVSAFCRENPRVSKSISKSYIITASGFQQLCKSLRLKVEMPKCFQQQIKNDRSMRMVDCMVTADRILSSPTKRISEATATEVDDLINTLATLKKERHAAVKLKCDDELITALERTIRHIGMVVAATCR